MGIRIKLWLLKKIDLSRQLSFKTLLKCVISHICSHLHNHHLFYLKCPLQLPTGPPVFKMTVGQLIRSGSVNLPNLLLFTSSLFSCLIFPVFLFLQSASFVLQNIYSLLFVSLFFSMPLYIEKSAIWMWCSNSNIMSVFICMKHCNVHSSHKNKTK